MATRARKHHGYLELRNVLSYLEFGQYIFHKNCLQTDWSHIRRWIPELEGYLPKEKREQLKADREQTDFEMVRSYQDSTGRTRVCWA